MLPGKMNPKQMARMMKQLGIKVREIEDVERVVIQTSTREYIFDEVEVTMMDAQGYKTYQIVGTPRIVERKQGIPKEDIELVMNQTGKTEEEAKKALEETDGDIAEAILRLTGE
ncbi:MAG: nascent polypeptide-associated complex protein [Thermoplasmata archaeon]|nr:MAG: nascent polypeptide-associated complex protein [Thermoplasmata archaeon]HEC89834.1 nascent polypeptide-associated complex protein [Thermoplasmatales archaeon]